MLERTLVIAAAGLSLVAAACHTPAPPQPLPPPTTAVPGPSSIVLGSMALAPSPAAPYQGHGSESLSPK
ncbi:MAG: hypothetical protein ACRENE_32525, partial [Polyangiaceae bacterium]